MVAQKEMLPNGNHSVSERTIASQNQNGFVLNNPRDNFGEELSLYDSGGKSQSMDATTLSPSEVIAKRHHQHARNGLRQFSRFLVAVAALVGVLATFCAGAQSCGIVQWGAGNEYPPGPYSSPVEACAIRNGEVDDASGGWGSGAIVTFSNAHVRASTWGGTPIGGYPGSGVSCGYTITITGPDISLPVVFDPGDSLPFVFAIVPPASCPKASPKRPRRKTSAVHARSPSAAIIVTYPDTFSRGC